MRKKFRFGAGALAAVLIAASVYFLVAPVSSAEGPYSSVLSADTVIEMVPVICTDSKCVSPDVTQCTYQKNRWCQFNQPGGPLCRTNHC